ncbi:MAG: hypothetical protein COA93_05170 [Alphaproteobacteria bacterium]|nr:MAG: hypothetical protein COA93_05170 [Alphaproteobacteria bacterium]
MILSGDSFIWLFICSYCVGPFGLEQISDVQIGFLLKIKSHLIKLYFNKYSLGRKLQHKIIKEACLNQLFFYTTL